MSETQQSGAVTALATISMVFGIIGMLGSFIPCLGAFAIFIAVPAAICGGAAFFIASSKKTSKGFAVAALTISLIGVVISGVQFMSLSTTAAALNEAAKQDALRRQQIFQQQQNQQTNE